MSSSVPKAWIPCVHWWPLKMVFSQLLSWTRNSHIQLCTECFHSTGTSNLIPPNLVSDIPLPLAVLLMPVNINSTFQKFWSCPLSHNLYPIHKQISLFLSWKYIQNLTHPLHLHCGSPSPYHQLLLTEQQPLAGPPCYSLLSTQPPVIFLKCQIKSLVCNGSLSEYMTWLTRFVPVTSPTTPSSHLATRLSVLLIPHLPSPQRTTFQLSLFVFSLSSQISALRHSHLRHLSCRMLVPQPGIEPSSSGSMEP